MSHNANFSCRSKSSLNNVGNYLISSIYLKVQFSTGSHFHRWFWGENEYSRALSHFLPLPHSTPPPPPSMLVFCKWRKERGEGTISKNKMAEYGLNFSSWSLQIRLGERGGEKNLNCFYPLRVEVMELWNSKNGRFCQNRLWSPTSHEVAWEIYNIAWNGIFCSCCCANFRQFGGFQQKPWSPSRGSHFQSLLHT